MTGNGDLLKGRRIDDHIQDKGQLPLTNGNNDLV